MAPRHPDLSQAIWRKSSYSSSTGQNCIEVATNLSGFVGVRDSKNPAEPGLIFAPDVWRIFISDIQQGRFTMSLVDSLPR